MEGKMFFEELTEENFRKAAKNHENRVTKIVTDPVATSAEKREMLDRHTLAAFIAITDAILNRNLAEGVPVSLLREATIGMIDSLLKLGEEAKKEIKPDDILRF